MWKYKGIAAALLVGGAGIAHADPCSITIEANDRMQYGTRELSVPASCTDIEVTLRHSGQLPVNVMGHDWVLAKAADVSGVLNAALAAGHAHGYLPANDKRIIAATSLVGGGESTTVKFTAAALEPGVRYAFFCSVPGHATLMRGSFLFGAESRLARAAK
jgi:azurin